MTPKILLLGASGQIGNAINNLFEKTCTVKVLTREDGADFMAPAELFECVDGHIARLNKESSDEPDDNPSNSTPNNDLFVINAAGYTGVDQAESDRGNAYTINALSTASLAQAAHKQNVWLIHFSTDYVFSGKEPGKWTETHPTEPVNFYGHTKLSAERYIQASKCRYLIFRTGWVYSLQNRPSNFLFNFLKKLLYGCPEDVIDVVSDQFGTPTSAELIAETTLSIIEKLVKDDLISLAAQQSTFKSRLSKQPRLLWPSGIYHLTAAGCTSRYKYAEHAWTLAQQRNNANPVPKSIPTVRAVLSKDNNTATQAERPKNSCLNTTKIENTFGIKLPHWSEGVCRATQTILSETLPANREEESSPAKTERDTT